MHAAESRSCNNGYRLGWRLSFSSVTSFSDRRFNPDAEFEYSGERLAMSNCPRPDTAPAELWLILPPPRGNGRGLRFVY